MRVLFSFPQAIGAPGVGTTAYQQVLGATGRGAHVTAVVASTSPGVALPEIRRVVRTLSIGRRRIPQRALGVQRSHDHHDRRAARTLARLASEIDLVHCWPGGCERTLLAAHRLGIPALRESPSAHTAEAFAQAAREQHEVGVELPHGHPFREDPVKLQRELREYDAASGILVPSDYALETFVRRGVPRGRLFRHRYGFDPDRFHPPQRERALEGGLTVAFVGRGEPTKGLHYALDAWHRSGIGERGRFLVAGAFVPEYERSLQTLLTRPGVEVLGYTADVEAVLQRADALVLPSVTEGSALVTYEAQGCGCVLLVSDASGADCRHLEHGLVHRARDVTAITRHLRQLDQDRPLLRRMRARVLERRASLTWGRAGERLAEVYEEARRATGSRTP